MPRERWERRILEEGTDRETARMREEEICWEVGQRLEEALDTARLLLDKPLRKELTEGLRELLLRIREFVMESAPFLE